MICGILLVALIHTHSTSHTCTHIYAHTHTHAHTHACMHTHTHTQPSHTAADGVPSDDVYERAVNLVTTVY